MGKWFSRREKFLGAVARVALQSSKTVLECIGELIISLSLRSYRFPNVVYFDFKQKAYDS